MIFAGKASGDPLYRQIEAEIIYRRSRDVEEEIKTVYFSRIRLEMRGALSFHESTESLADAKPTVSLETRRIVAVGCVVRIV